MNRYMHINKCAVPGEMLHYAQLVRGCTVFERKNEIIFLPSNLNIETILLSTHNIYFG